MELDEKKQPVTLTEYFLGLPYMTSPRAALETRITVELGVPRTTVGRWLRQGITPTQREHCDAIARMLNRPVTELFPNYSKKFLR